MAATATSVTTESAEVSFLLFCSGAADARSFRPELDESQWWGRRDALVRCTSVLWAGRGVRAPCVREICLLHAADLAILRVGAEAVRSCPTPTEHALVGAWRLAAQGGAGVAGVVCERDVWRAAILEPSAPLAGGAAGTGSRAAEAARPSPAELELLDKREILAFLHGRCALPFLRAHGLNSGADAVLKKANKARLIGAYGAWLAEGAGRAGGEPSPAVVLTVASGAAPDPEAARGVAAGHGSGQGSGGTLQRTLEHLLRPGGAQHVGTTAVLLLHEDCADELPVFGCPREPAGARWPPQPAHVIAVLGAVRDMSEEEGVALSCACAALGLPLVRANLGRTAEFSSKVMAAIAFHARARVLGGAVRRLLARAGERAAAAPPTTLPGTPPHPPSTALPAAGAAAGSGRARPPLLHVVAAFPFAAAELDSSRDLARGGAALAARAEAHALLRLAVCALWRSRLAAEAAPADDADAPGCVRTALTLAFRCGTVLPLSQDSLVRAMAAKHQAAPSEAQLLAAICDARDALPRGEAPLGIARGLARALERVGCGAARPILLRLGCGGEEAAGDAAAGGAGRAEGAGLDVAAEAYARPCECAAQAQARAHGGAAHAQGEAHIVLLCPAAIGGDGAGEADPGSARGRARAGREARQLPSEEEWAHAVRAAFPQAGGARTRRICLGDGADDGAPQADGAQMPAASAALAVTMLQHFAYHGRLLPALQRGDAGGGADSTAPQPQPARKKRRPEPARD